MNPKCTMRLEKCTYKFVMWQVSVEDSLIAHYKQAEFEENVPIYHDNEAENMIVELTVVICFAFLDGTFIHLISEFSQTIFS